MGQLLLIVDDARLARLMIRGFASRVRPDVTVMEAADGAQALEMLQNIPSLDYVTVDYNMPGMNGLDLAVILQHRYPGARVALLTANVQVALRRRAADAGVEFLDKPINEAKIAAFLAPAGES